MEDQHSNIEQSILYLAIFLLDDVQSLSILTEGPLTLVLNWPFKPELVKVVFWAPVFFVRAIFIKLCDCPWNMLLRIIWVMEILFFVLSRKLLPV